MTALRLLLAAPLALAAQACATARAAPPPAARVEAERLIRRLERPEGPGPFAAVILLHGCSGPHRKDRAWAEWLAGEGYVAVVTDSFRPRGVKEVCGKKDQVGPTASDRVLDAAEVRRHLRTLPFVDPARIAVMGFSHGGKTALRAAVRGAGAPEEPFVAAVALYPPCSFRWKPRMAVQSPLLVLSGGADDWALASWCQDFAAAARGHGEPLSLTVYPGALHGFDSEGLDSWKLGHHLRHDPAAHADAQGKVGAFLRERLGTGQRAPAPAPAAPQ